MQVIYYQYNEWSRILSDPIEGACKANQTR